MRICVDPGHGGIKTGAIGPTGREEKEINLIAGLALKEFLEQAAHKVLITREDDSDVRLSNRCKMANNFGADLFLSLHCNAVPASVNPNKVSGIECYTSKGETVADDWARRFQKALLARFPDHKDFAGAGTSEENFFVLKHTKMPAVLIEMEFISHPDMETFLVDKYGAIALALATEIGPAEKKTAPKEQS